MPVGLVNSLRPLGHSGQRRLQLVVGSKEMETGKPHWMGLFSNLLNWKLENTFIPFQIRGSVNLPIKFVVSLKLNAGTAQKYCYFPSGAGHKNECPNE